MDKNDLISRSATLRAMKMDIAPPFRVVMEMPAIDPEELRPRGRWVYDNHGAPCCSICGGVDALDREEYLIRDKIRDNASNYCPNCGAKMTEVISHDAKKIY